jgi:hypothetical protein
LSLLQNEADLSGQVRREKQSTKTADQIRK